MSQSEAAIRRAGAVVALVAASALMAMGFPAVEARADVVLALHAILQLGCAAVLLSMAHGAVADLACRATEAARGTAAAALGTSWLGFAGIVLYALYVAGDVAARNEAAAEAEAAWPDAVRDFLLFLTFLASVWAVYLSMIRERGGPPPPATAAAEASLDDAAGVWAIYMPVIATDTGKGGPQSPPLAAAEQDPDGGEVNTVAPARGVVDSKL